MLVRQLLVVVQHVELREAKIWWLVPSIGQLRTLSLLLHHVQLSLEGCILRHRRADTAVLIQHTLTIGHVRKIGLRGTVAVSEELCRALLLVREDLGSGPRALLRLLNVRSSR